MTCVQHDGMCFMTEAGPRHCLGGKDLADENKDIKTADTNNSERREPTTDEIIAAVQAALAKSIQKDMKDGETEQQDMTEVSAEAPAEAAVDEAAPAPEAAGVKIPKMEEEELPEINVETPEEEELPEIKVEAPAEEELPEIKVEVPAEEELPEIKVEVPDEAAEESAPEETAQPVKPETEETSQAPSGNTEMIMDLKEKIEEAVKEDQLAKEEAQKAAKAERIKKRNQAIIRRRIIITAVIAAVVIVAAVLFGMYRNGAWEDRAEVNTLTLNEDGSIVYEEILEIEGTSKKELKSYVEEQIASYNEAAGEEKITLERFASGKTGYYVRMTYSDSAAYADFTGYWLTTGSVQSTINAGITFPEAMVAVEDGEKTDSVTSEDVQKETSLKLLTIQENTTVIVPGTIEYVTDECTTIDGENTVTITAVEGDEDAAALTFIVYSADDSEETTEDAASEETAEDAE